MIARATGRAGRGLALALVITLVAPTLGLLPAGTGFLPRAEALEFPTDGPTAGWNIQTNGRSAASGLGDWYTNSGGGNVDHFLSIVVPCEWPTGTLINVDLYSPEINSNGPDVGDLEEPGNGGTAYFGLYGPYPDRTVADGTRPPIGDPAELVITPFSEVPGGGALPTWVNLTTINVGVTGCGIYLLRSGITEATSTAQNGWRLRVGAGTTGSVLNSDPDGLVGTNDELLVGIYETTFQDDGGSGGCISLWEYVQPGTAEFRFHNFDMDGNVSVGYAAPSGAGLGGSVSGGDVWNNGRAVGDLIDGTDAESGWWRLDTCANDHNQFIQEGQTSVMAFVEMPPVPDVSATKADDPDPVVRGDTLTYTIDVTNAPAATGAAVNVEVTDVLPAGVTFVSCEWQDAAGSCGESTGTVTANRLSVHADSTETLEITVSVDVDAVSPLSNTATITFTDAIGNTYLDESTNAETTIVWSPTIDGSVCWAVSDGTDQLLRYDLATGAVAVVGDVGVANVEAIALHPTTKVLWAANAGQLGTINLADGSFSSTDTLDAGDADGMTFHPFTGAMYVTDRLGAEDELYEVDETDGSTVSGPITIAAPPGFGTLQDIDDIAISPIDGVAYAIANDGNDDHLVTVDLGNGATVDLGIIELGGTTQIDDVEGLSFTVDGTLLATTGNSSTTASARDSLYTITPTAGAATPSVATLVGPFGVGSDFEALACMTGAANSISGTVFQDRDEDGVFDVGEPTRDGITVTLQRVGGPVLDTTTTAGGGAYSFAFAATGEFEVVLDSADPAFAGELVTPADAVTVDFGTAVGDTRAVDFWYRNGLIRGLAWLDLNHDGIRNGADAAITDGSVAFALWRESGTTPGLQTVGVDADTLVAGPTAAGVDGTYEFVDLAAGDYYVVATPGALAFTLQDVAPDTTDSDVDPTTGVTALITVATGDHVNNVDAGVWDAGNVTVHVFEDVNGDALLDAGDTRLPGVGVTLYRDTNANGSLEVGVDAEVGTLPTNGTGTAAFGGLEPDRYFTVVDAAAVALQVTDATLSTANETDTVVVVSGATEVVDVGYYTPIDISGHAWLDLDADGAYEPGASETLIDGVTVNLRDDEGGLVATDTTGSVTPGEYAFLDLAPGPYRIEVIDAAGRLFSPQNATVDSADSDVNPLDGLSALVTYDSGDAESDLDAGLYARGSIAGRVWHDVDADSLDEPSDPTNPEAGVGSVTVNLLDGSGNPLPIAPETTTAGTGAYSFADLDPGTYIVEVVPAGRSISPQTDDSDVNVGTGRSGVITVTSGAAVTGIDAGLYDPVVLTGRLWVDDDGDGTQNDGASGIVGEDVTITGPGGPYTVSTGADGQWTTASLPGDLMPGTYTVAYPTVGVNVFTPADQGGNDALDSDVDAAGDVTVTLLSGEAADLDAGVYETVTIGDRVWTDVDGDGVFTPGTDTGLNGVTVELLDGGGALIADTVSATVLTVDGVYGFSGLAPGTYELRFVASGTQVFTIVDEPTATEATDSDAAADGTTGTFAMASGDTRDDLDAGLYVPASLGDLVWDDLDADGVFESGAGEPGLAGVSLSLSGPNGFSASTVSSDGTGLPLGGYVFSGLAPGSYTLTVGATAGRALSPTGAGTAGTDSDPDVTTRQVTVVLSSGDAVVTTDVGLFATSTVGDRIWLDVDGDGVQAVSGEPDLSGVSVTVSLVQGGSVAARPDGSLLQVTTLTGSYSIGDVPPGSYTVRFDLPEPYRFTLQGVGSDGAVDSDVVPPSSGDLTVGDTGAVTVDPVVATVIDTVDAGVFLLGSIAGEVWEDIDGDAVREPGDGEALVAGTTVELYRVGGPLTPVDSTPATAGSYSFSGVAPGDYEVRFVPPVGDGLTDQSAGSLPDPGTGRAAVSVASGQDVTGIDAGVFTLVELGDLVWIDADGDGLKGGSESGLGATLRLHRPGDLSLGSELDTVTSNGSTGAYAFTGVAPGSYVVVVELPGAYVPTVANVVGDDTIDSDVTQGAGATAVTGTIVLLSGVDNGTVDAGLYVPASLGDLVWDDLDADGVFESGAGEPGLAGVSLSLSGPNGFSASTVSSDGTGLPLGGYVFSGLAPGSYTLTVGATAGRALSPTGAGTAGTDSDPDVTTRQVTVVLSSGDAVVTTDVGLFATSTVGDRIWLDVDGDGVQAVSGEGDLSGVSVTVSLVQGGSVAARPDGSLLQVTTLTGSYSIGDVPPGSYTVRFDLPEPYRFTLQGVGSDGAVDSDVVPPSSGDLTVGDTGAVTVDPVVATVIDTVDAGVFLLGSIAGEVWEDIDGDAVREPGAGEALIGGTTINLYRASAPLTVFRTEADADGSYSFTSLPPGDYEVEVVPATGDGLTDQSVDSLPDPGTGRAAVSVASGQDVTGIDAGVFTLVTIGDRVWTDVDGDGVFTPGTDTGLNGVTVQLLDDGGSMVATTASDTVGPDDGVYGFSGLAPGTYELRFVASGAQVFTIVDEPTATEATDSDAAADGTTGTFAMASGDTRDDLDAGLYVPASLGDLVWDDLDADGVFESGAGEPGLAGVSLSLSGPNGFSASTVSSDGTGLPLGGYVFSGLAPGSYTLTVGATAGRALSPTGAGTAGTDSDPDVTTRQVTVVLSSGDAVVTTDVGLFATSTVGDRIWLDVDGDGVQAVSGEGDLSGVSVTVSLVQGGSVAARPDGSLLQVTTLTGSYSIGDVPPGSYTVRFDLPEPYRFTLQGVGSDGAVDSDVVPPSSGDLTVGDTGAVTVDPVVATVIDTVDAGVFLLGSIAGEVWEDIDGDAVRDAGDDAVTGTTVELYRVGGPLTPVDTTPATGGTYTFSDVAPGDYQVRFVPPAGQALTDQSVDSLPAPATGTTPPFALASDEDLTGIDAGVFTLVDIGDLVWTDVNGDGIQQVLEPGIGGVTVRLHDPSDLTPGSQLDSVVSTAVTGAYTFADVAPGSYVLVFQTPAGFVPTLDGEGVDGDADSDVTDGGTLPATAVTATFSVTSGLSRDDLDAGFYVPASLGDLVWDDLDADGVFESGAGEPGLAGVSLSLSGPNGFSASTVSSDGTGLPLGGYVFSGLAPGSYTLTVGATAGRALSPTGAGTAGTDSDPDVTTRQVTVVLSSGDAVVTTDVGLFATSTVGDRIWLDVDGDGVQAVSGEPDLSGVSVTVSLVQGGSVAARPDGSLLQVTTLTGSYSIGDVPPGSYTVRFDLPEPYRFTLQGVGSDGAVDSDVVPPSSGDLTVGDTGAVTVDPVVATVIDTVDAGVFLLGSIAGEVWEDIDGDAVREPGAGEALIGGTTINLYRASDLVSPYLTDSDLDASYSFGDLAPGGYVVEFVPATGDGLTDQSADSLPDPSTRRIAVTVVSDEDVTGVDAGVFTLVDIGDLVWTDVNGDGIQQVLEPGIGGVTVRLHDPSDLTPGSQLDSVVSTAVTGAYTFVDVAPGSYVLVFQTPAGFVPTLADEGVDDDVDSDVTDGATAPATAVTGTFAVTSGTDDDSVDAGFYVPASISGRIYDDQDGDAVDDGEPGWAGVDVVLSSDFDGDGTYVFERSVPAAPLSGDYVFADLRPGAYRILVDTGDLPADAILTTANQPLDVVLASADARTDQDVGYRQPGTISGLVFDDVGGDGSSAGDPVFFNVEVRLLRPDGSVVLTDLTDGAGRYSFDLLVPGTYEVHVTDPTRFVLTTANDPTTVVVVPTTDEVVDFGFQAYAPAVTVAPDGSLVTEVGPSSDVTVVHPHRVTNVGNVADTYDLAVSGNTWAVSLIADADGDGVLDPGETTVVADTGSLTPGAFTDVLAVVTVPAGTARGTVDGLTLTATSRVGPGDPGDPPIEASASDVTTAVAPVLEVTKTSALAGAPAVPGQRITYTIEVANLLPDANVATATGISVADVLADPSHGSFDAASVRIDGVLQPNPTTFPLALGDIAAGSAVTVSVDLVVARPLVNGTVITDVATVTATNPQVYDAGGTPVTQVSGAASDVVSSLPLPQLVVTSTPLPGSTVEPGDTITYRATISNRVDATDTWRDVFALHDLPSSGVVYVSGTATVGGAPIADASGGANPFDPPGGGVPLGNLVPGGAVTITFDVRVLDPVADGLPLVALSSALGSNGGPLFGVVNHTTEVAPNVSLTPDGARTVEPGTTVVYPHLLTNTGNATGVYDLSVDSDTGAVVTLVHDVNGDGVRGAGEPVVSATQTLAPGAFQRLLVVVAIPTGVASGTVDTTTVVATSRLDRAVLAQAFDVTTVVAGVLELVKSATPASSSVNPGQVVTYRIEVRNTGGAPVRGVVVTDDTPSSATYRRGTTRLDGVPIPDGSGALANPLASAGPGLPLGDLAAGAARVVTFDVQVSSTLPDRSLLVNVAEAVSSDGRTAEDSVSQLVTASPVLDIGKVASPPAGPITPGQTITYTVTVRNVGNAAATGVVVKDDVPGRASYVAGSTRLDGALVPDVGGATPAPLSSPNAGVAVGRLEPGGAARILTFDVRMDDPLPDGVQITNVAAVTSAEGVTARSVAVRHTVRVKAGVRLVPDNALLVEAPGRAVHPHTVTNNGTGTDTIVLSTVSSRGWATTLYRDDNGDGVWGLDEGTVVGSTGPLAAGASFAFFAVVDVPAGAPMGAIDVLDVKAASTVDPSVSSLAVDTTTVVAPQLTFAKTSVPSGDQINPGATVTYRLTVTNAGRAIARDVIVTDDAPAGTVYVTGSAAVNGVSIGDETNGDGNPFSLANAGHALVTVPGRTSVTLSFDVEVPLTAVVGDTVTNVATLSTPGLPVLDATRTHTVTAGPVLDVIKSATPGTSGTLTAGDVVRYTVVVRNVGALPATDVRLADDTPLNTTYLTGTATLDGTPVPDGSTDPNPFGSSAGGYTIGTLAPNAQATATIDVAVLETVSDDDVVANVAVATSFEGAAARSPVVTHLVDVTPMVELTPTWDVIAQPGGTVTLAHVVANTGDVPDVYDLTVAGQLGWVARLFEDVDGDGTLDDGEPEVTTTPTLEPGQTFDLLVVVDVPVSASVGDVDTLDVRARSVEDPATAGKATDTVTVVEGTLTLLKTASPSTVRAGGSATYTLTVMNAGSAPIADVRLFDTAPAGTTFVPGSVTLDGVPIADAVGVNPLRAGLSVGPIEPGGSAIATFEVRVEADPDRTVVINAAEAVATGLPPARAGTVQPYATERGLDVTPGTTETVRPGTTVIYPHTVTNVGDLVDEVVIAVVSAFGLESSVVRDLDGDGVVDPGEPEVTSALTLDPGGSADLLVLVVVPPDAPSGLEDELTVSATSLSDATLVVTATDVTIVMAPVLQIVKAAQPSVNVEAGGLIRYGIAVTNTGTDPATDVVIGDPVPAGTSYVAGSTTVDGVVVEDVGAGSPLDVGLDVGDLEPGTSRVVAFSVRVQPGVVPGAILTNVATVASAETATTPSAPVALTVTGAAALRIDKSAEPATGVPPGGTVRWTIQVTNVGTTPIPEILLTDALAAGLAYVPGTTTVDGTSVGDGVASGAPVAIGGLEPGQVRTVAFDTAVGQVADGTILQNAATATNGINGTTVLSNAASVAVDELAAGLPETGFFGGRTLSVAVVMTGAGWALLYAARPERRPRPVLRRRSRRNGSARAHLRHRQT